MQSSQTGINARTQGQNPSAQTGVLEAAWSRKEGRKDCHATIGRFTQGGSLQAPMGGGRSKSSVIAHGDIPRSHDVRTRNVPVDASSRSWHHSSSSYSFLKSS